MINYDSISKVVQKGLITVITLEALCFGGLKILEKAGELERTGNSERPHVVTTYLKNENTGFYDRILRDQYRGQRKIGEKEIELPNLREPLTKNYIQKTLVSGFGEEVRFEE